VCAHEDIATAEALVCARQRPPQPSLRPDKRPIFLVCFHCHSCEERTGQEQRIAR
jgi:hypothetical protein